MSNELRTYRLVTKIHTNGLGSLECFSTPFRTYGDPFSMKKRQEAFEIDIERVEEFINGHWWKVA